MGETPIPVFSLKLDPTDANHKVDFGGEGPGLSCDKPSVVPCLSQSERFQTTAS